MEEETETKRGEEKEENEKEGRRRMRRFENAILFTWKVPRNAGGLKELEKESGFSLRISGEIPLLLSQLAQHLLCDSPSHVLHAGSPQCSAGSHLTSRLSVFPPPMPLHIS
jgi:hypothetical protein